MNIKHNTPNFRHNKHFCCYMYEVKILGVKFIFTESNFHQWLYNILTE